MSTVKSSACQNTYFSTQLAIELKSTELAIILQFFINVISVHKRMGRGFIDGFTWNYCSTKDLIEYFPFWTEKMIRARIQMLVKMGILKTGNFNEKKYDRTLWYAFIDEKKWGLESIEAILPNGKMDIPKRENGYSQMGTPIPSIKTSTNHAAKKVIDAAAPSLPQKKAKGSLFKGKAKFTEVQENCLEWLKAQGINTSDDTLSWWARTYTIARLEEVIREAKKRNPASLAAYMQKLLKGQIVVVSGRIELNAEYAALIKELNGWNRLEIHQKYAKITGGSSPIEIDFNMEHEEFKRYIQQKLEIYGDN